MESPDISATLSQPASETEKRLHFILDIIQEGVWEWNSNSGHVRRSPGWYRMLKYSEKEGLAENTLTWEKIIHPDDYPRVMKHFEDYIFGRSNHYQVEYRARVADGNYLWIRDQARIVERNTDGSLALMIGAHLNIDAEKRALDSLQQQQQLLDSNRFTIESLIQQRTQELSSAKSSLEQSLEKIERLRITDPLTGIYNRYKIEEELEREMARAKRYRSPLCVALFDIDHFKAINDKQGHPAGDEALKRVCQVTRENLRSSDTLGRWGGDEFVIILPGVGIHGASEGLQKVRRLIAADDNNGGIQVTCSFGITQYRSGDNADLLCKRADKALYDAKNSGRNRICSSY